MSQRRWPWEISVPPPFLFLMTSNLLTLFLPIVITVGTAKVCGINHIKHSSVWCTVGVHWGVCLTTHVRLCTFSPRCNQSQGLNSSSYKDSGTLCNWQSRGFGCSHQWSAARCLQWHPVACLQGDHFFISLWSTDVGLVELSQDQTPKSNKWAISTPGDSWVNWESKTKVNYAVVFSRMVEAVLDVFCWKSYPFPTPTPKVMKAWQAGPAFAPSKFCRQ